MAIALKPGTIFVTFTKGLNLPRHFEVLEQKRYKMSWGPATVFIHRRLQEDGSSVGGFHLNVLPSDDQSYSDTEEDADRGRGFSRDDDEEEEDDDEDEGDEDEEDSYSDDDFEGEESPGSNLDALTGQTGAPKAGAPSSSLQVKVTPLTSKC